MYKQAEIEKWGTDRDLYKQSNFEAQFEKLLEEFTELYSAIRTNNIEEIKDAIGDNYVVLVHLMKFAGMTIQCDWESADPHSDSVVMLMDSYNWILSERHGEDYYFWAIEHLKLIAIKHGVSFEDCVDGAVATISTRTGRFINGVYVKDAK